MFKNMIGALIVLFMVQESMAQTLEQTSQYVSQVDQDITINKIAILPVTDNLDGIYARPIEVELSNLVKKNHKLDFIEGNITESPSLLDLEESPKELAKLTSKIDTDALIAARLSKGPSGTSIRLDLFLKSDNKLFAQEILKDYPRFEINDLKEQLSNMYSKLMAKIPYNGQILSRQQNRVTINIGKSDGISKDQILSVIQVIKVTRHPKYNFLINTEKEILGKIKVLKVDENLSFASIITEKEKGAIKKAAKISGIDFVNYAIPDELAGSQQKNSSLADRQDSNVAFGKAPGEWIPTQPPMFGQVGLKLGFGTFGENLNLTNINPATSVGGLNGKASFYPSLDLYGELWLNPKWQLRAEILQGVISTDNPRAGSAPSTLNDSLSYYSLVVGYNFLLRNDFFGPKLRLDLGLMSYRMFVDASQPEAFSTANYSGVLVGVTGILPIDARGDISVGASFNLVLLPKLQEQPEASGGGPNNNINSFSVFAEKKLRENIKLVTSLDFLLVSTSFSGPGERAGGEYATSMSQRLSSINLGVAYLF
jgi:hypothetical protein